MKIHGQALILKNLNLNPENRRHLSGQPHRPPQKVLQCLHFLTLAPQKPSSVARFYTSTYQNRAKLWECCSKNTFGIFAEKPNRTTVPQCMHFSIIAGKKCTRVLRYTPLHAKTILVTVLRRARCHHSDEQRCTVEFTCLRQKNLQPMQSCPETHVHESAMSQK